MTTALVKPEATATITVPEPVVDTPAYNETIYAYGFEEYSEVLHPEVVTFSDDFSAPLNLDNWTVDGWDGMEEGAGAYSEATVVGGVLRLTGAGQYGSVEAYVTDHDLAGGFVSVRVSNNGATSRYNDAGINVRLQSTYTAWAGVLDDLDGVYLAGNFRRVSPWASLYFPDQVPYDPNVHRYLRIREQDGTLYYEYSANGATWTVYGSYVHGLADTVFMAEEIRLAIYNGDDPLSSGSPDYPVVATFDDFKVGINAWTEVVNNGLAGWAAGSGHSGAVAEYPSVGEALRLWGGSGNIEAERTMTGLVVGHSYTARAKVSSRSDSDPDYGWLAVIGKSTGSSVLTDADSKIQATASYTFVATATSHVLQLVGFAGSDLLWDDVTLVHHVPATYTTTPELTITEGKVTVADDWSPYIQAVFDVPLTGSDLLEQIDPKTSQRVTVAAEETIGGTSRTFNLGLRVREVDHAAKKITIELASDEALLMDRKNVSASVDTTPRTHAASLRAVCNWALGKIGASLEAGTADANLTPYWALTNLMPNPDMDANVTGYTAGTGCTIAHNAGADSGGSTGFLRATLSAASAFIYLAPTASGATSGYTVQPGRTYALTAAVRQNVAGGSFAMYLRYVDAAGNQIGTSTSTVWTLATTFGSTRYTTIATAPAGAAKAHPYINVTGSASGRTVDVDRVTLVEDNEAPTYFDGSTTQTGYIMAWSDTTNASTSTRTPTVDRPRELLYWKPGQSLWDFLTPLVERAGLRLFCDENRDWRLVNPDTYDVPGYVVVQEKHNATRGTDKITRNDDTWADAVVCIYEWDDANGIRRTAYDFAGSTTGKCVTFTYDRAFPGPGAAAYALGRLQGTGRTQDVTCLTQYSATPGQDVTINLPGTLSQTGKIREVIFDLRTGLMDLGTRGLADALPGSWALWDPDQTWSEVNATLNWADL